MYPYETVERLTLVLRALTRGQRPRDVLSLDLDALSKLVVPPPHGTVAPMSCEAWLSWSLGSSPEEIDAALHEECARLGPARFLKERAVPLVDAMTDQPRGGVILDRVRAMLSTLWCGGCRGEASTSVIVAGLAGGGADVRQHLIAALLCCSGVRVYVMGVGNDEQAVRELADQVAPVGLVLDGEGETGELELTWPVFQLGAQIGGQSVVDWTQGL
jgi:hypothetical protein